jgi:hypothetical protein
MDRSLFMTLSFPYRTNLQQAARTLKRLEKVIPKYFSAYIWVLVIKDNEDPITRRHYRTIHAHMVVAAHEDIRTGTDFDVFDRYRAIQKAAKDAHRRLTVEELAERRKLVKRITTNKALKAIWSGLRKKLPKLGFASKMPFELLPIYTDAHTAGCYMAQNFRESSENKNRHDGRIHLWGTSQNVPRVVPRLDSISLLTAGAAGWRKMVCLAAGSVGITSIEQLTEEYGHRWAHWGRKVVKWLFEETRANGVTPGIDAIREKMIEMCGRPLSWISPVDAGLSLAEQTWADIQAELIRMAPMRAAVLASQPDLALAS